MGKKRVYEAARELGLTPKELLERLHEVGVEKTSNFSALEEEEIEVIAELFPKGGDGKAQVETAEAKAEAKPAPPPAPEPPQAAAPPTEPEAEVEAEAKAKVEKAKEPARVRGEPRPPIVAVLGHVDHGKTTLLDTIRKTQVAPSEAGGITQSIGAYQVTYQGRKITFIDTPGHAAFTTMRARGAQATDIVVLVVAADDGVMAQTVEAVDHARAAGVPIIVAINKVDKAPNRVDRVKEQLAKLGLTPEDWGGETICVPLSALHGDGVEDLLEMILLSAELQELRADPDGPAQGIVIESHLDPGRGPVASVIVRDGSLRERDTVVAGTAYGRIRALLDEGGRKLQVAKPGTPVQILGLSEVPPAGMPLEVCRNANEAKARALERQRVQQERERERRRAAPRRSVAELMSQMLKKGRLKVVLKADSVGCLEALEGELKKFDFKDVSLEVLHAGVGQITENDVLLASSAGEGQAVVIGFRTPVERGAAEMAQRERVTLRTYNVIYDLTKDVERALKRLMEPEYRETKLGELEVRNVFKVPRVGAIAGCYVKDGFVSRSARVRVFRGGAQVHEGPIRSLKRFDEDVRRVEKGKECGLKLEGFEDVQVGDRIEAFSVERVERL